MKISFIFIKFNKVELPLYLYRHFVFSFFLSNCFSCVEKFVLKLLFAARYCILYSYEVFGHKCFLSDRYSFSIVTCYFICE